MSNTRLVKSRRNTVIPGTPGSAGIPGTVGIPGTPGYFSVSYSIVRKCTIVDEPSAAYTPSSEGYFTDVSIVTGNGYELPIRRGSLSDVPATVKTTLCQNVSKSSTTYHGAVPGSPSSTGTPGTPATPARLVVHLNEGWNSYSRSIDQFEAGKNISYTVSEGVRGALISIGVDKKLGDPTSSFSHSVFVEPGGIMVVENGETIETVKYHRDSTSVIRLFIQDDRSVICVVTTGTETLVFKFSEAAHALRSVPLYAYAHLYIADDAVNNAAYTSGQVHFGEA